MNDAPEETVEPTPKTSRTRLLRGWMSKQSRLRLGLIGVVALALVAGAWTGVSYASDGSEPVEAKSNASSPAADSQLLSPDPRPSKPPKEEKTEEEKKEKPQPKPTEEEETTTEEPVAAGCEDFSGNQLTACKMLDDHGFGSGEMECLNNLWDHESGWNHKASNPSSGAYGIPQALPGDKMATAGSDWSTNPATQIEWGLGYIGDRYDTPCGAWNFWQNNNYY